MNVEIAGTGGPHGWPQEGCRCASCGRMRAGGARRAPTEVIADGVVLAPGTEVVSGDGIRVLYGGTPRSPGAYDLVLADLAGGPERLALLRRDGAVGPGTRVVAVGLDHRMPSEAELTRRLGFWGAGAVPDGTTLTLSPRAGDGLAVRPAPRRTLILGGSRSGKSAEAELRLLAEPRVVYVATGRTGDDDPRWRARVEAHRARRPAHWETVETTDLVPLLRESAGPLLVDGLGTWVTAVFDRYGGWDGADCSTRLAELVEAWRNSAARVVAVSDEVGLGVVPSTASGGLFRDALGRLNQRLAAESEETALVVAGKVVELG
ncbi:bifunctional adenosylcobinamide kinase/adenosylcobinamide-phosphate guanylyltransferase [Rhizohabitans arisaemae]|uniref:bifunctional adenosylcobinamide kinase/adenosylcobinamide-phosphate guanylyltransferase n=1 Tax=Rhizohabitans arisaemae TaxID=2720610 RepID=UPI0024B14E13|nr:bifunctional adenosylcobinamide kinase/adenosylcobinamide-phosphate guanylyltransferase [Rhizohabitans arisaemae]